MSDNETMSPTFNRKRFRRRSIIVFLFLIFMVMIVIAAFSSVYGQSTVVSWIHQAQFYVVPIKWVIEIAVIWHWHTVINRSAKRLNLPAEHREYLIRARWVAARFLAVVETLLLIQLLNT